MLRNSATRYGLISRLFHWLIAVLMIGLIGLGWWMVRLDYYDPNYGVALMLHRSFGMALLSLACLQIAWKLVSPSPPIQTAIALWQRIAARGMHGLLLLLIVAIPVSGYLLTTLGRVRVCRVWFVRCSGRAACDRIGARLGGNGPLFRELRFACSCRRSFRRCHQASALGWGRHAATDDLKGRPATRQFF